MEVIKIKNKKAFTAAYKIIKAGGVIICPTDTVYGFLADATNKKAVERIYKMKKRPRSKPLPIFVSDIKAAEKLVFVNDNQRKILREKWPGKHTFVLRRKKMGKIYGINKGAIALRVPKYKFLNDLLKKAKNPLAQTSVNVSGQPAIIKIKGIVKVFGVGKNAPELIIDAGNLLKSKPSIIIDLTKEKNKILRR